MQRTEPSHSLMRISSLRTKGVFSYMDFWEWPNPVAHKDQLKISKVPQVNSAQHGKALFPSCGTQRCLSPLLEQQFLEINKSLDSVLLFFLSSAVDIMVQQSWVWRVWTFKTRQRGQKVINFLLLMLEGNGGEEKKKSWHLYLLCLVHSYVEKYN